MANLTWHNDNDAIVINVPYKRRVNWSQTFLITSDVHIDNKECRRDMFKRHLQEMIERDAYWIDNGDYFDAMGGKFDKRSNKSSLLPELQTGEYFDTLIDFGGKFITPEVAKRTILLADGNHELSVNQRHEINLLNRLRDKYAPKAIRQSYDGFIRFQFKEHDKHNHSLSFVMFRTHGTGGNAPVTRGAIQTNRRQDMILADCFISGHIHTAYSMPRPQWRLSSENRIKIHEVEHWQVGTYKDSTKSTWEKTKGFSPPMIGGLWLTFKYVSYRLSNGSYDGRIIVTAERAL